MFSLIKSATLIGIDAIEIQVEIDAKKGLPSENIVGLPDTVIKESKSRIKAAIKNSGFEYPIKNYTINLAPADLPKIGSTLDLPIAVGLLVVTGQIEAPPPFFYVGELSLNGSIKPIKGILSICDMISKSNYKKVILPYENSDEAQLIPNIEIFPIKVLADILDITKKPHKIKTPIYSKPKESDLDYIDVNGQHIGKRAMEITAAGRHNCLLIGPPGSGKSMLLQRLPGILPSLNKQAAIETMKIHSVSNRNSPNHLSLSPPFRTPHHSTSHVGLVGGGSTPLPGEISLAHNGILFLDEFPEFSRKSLEVLREPLENKKITINRANQSITYPANFLLVAAMNPCPCGYATDDQIDCSCSDYSKQRYLKKLSGPLLDRFDLIIEIKRLKKQDITLNTPNKKTSSKMSELIQKSIEIQHQRYEDSLQNAQLSSKQHRKHIQLSHSQKDLLGHYVDKGLLTGRSYDKVSKVARTIADLEQSDCIKDEHIAEALQYRQFLLKTSS